MVKQLLQNLDRIQVTFDDQHAAPDAGLLLPATLCEKLGLRGLFDKMVKLSRPGHANVGLKAMTLIHSALAGGDCIDDTDTIRTACTPDVLGHEVRAPSTVGTFLRAFTWGHVRQVDRVADEALRRAWQAGCGPAAGEAVTVDIDSTICETYGLAKIGGSRFCHTHDGWVRGYHPLLATVAGYGDVVHSRLRGGPAHTAKGAASFIVETINRVRRAGASGSILLRADSGYYNRHVVAACRNKDVRFSITVPQNKAIRKAIARIPDDAWAPIPYWCDEGADIAETTYRPFEQSKKTPVRLVVRRTKPNPDSQLSFLVDYDYHAFITDRTGDTLDADTDHRRHAQIENVIRDLKYGVGLNHMPSGNFNANGAWMTLNVLAHNIGRWTSRIGELENVAETTTKTLRRRYFNLPGRFTRSSRRQTLHFPAEWPWATKFLTGLDRIRNLPQLI